MTWAFAQSSSSFVICPRLSQSTTTGGTKNQNTISGHDANVKRTFIQLAQKVAAATGSPYASIAALLIIIIWVVAGFILGFSDTHQLIINTSTTIITFLMVFVIQATQNHDTRAMQLKLDEIIHALQDADDTINAAEDMEPDELKARLQERKASE